MIVHTLLYIIIPIDCVSFRLESSEVYCAFSLFDPRHLPTREDQLDTYGQESLQTLIDFYGKEQEVTFGDQSAVSEPVIDPELTQAE